MSTEFTIQCLRDACDAHRGLEIRLRAAIAERDATIAALEKKLDALTRGPESTAWISGLTREQMRSLGY